jgi:hypothetical protein
MRKLLAMALVGAGILGVGAASAANVRTDHPRLLFGSGSGFGTTVAQFKQRCNGNDPVYAHRCQYMGGGQGNPGFMASSVGDIQGMAAAYLLWGGDQRCTNAADWLLANLPMDGPGPMGDAHGFISSYASTLPVMAIVRDWCDPALDAGRKTQLEDRIDTWLHWFWTNYTGPGQVPMPGGDVFHDDYSNVAHAVAWAGLILNGTAHDADATTARAWADQRWKQVLLPAMAYVGDWWPEGFTYIQPTLGGLASYAAAWSTATDENIYDYIKSNAKNILESYLYFFVYAQRPDTSFVYFGDTTHTKQGDQLFIYPLALTMSYGVGSPVGQGFLQAVTAATTKQAGFCSDVACADGWMVALMYDSSKDAAAMPASTLPTARWLSPGANDIAIFRSGWGQDDTFVWMQCGDYFGAHGHDEAGSFQIFRHGMLTGPTGGYDAFGSTHWDNYYSQHSVHANTIAVREPMELFPTSAVVGTPQMANQLNVNDGGQRVLRRTLDGTVVGAYGSTDLATYQKYQTNKPFYETGDIKTFEHATCHDYVACDVTAAYDSPGYTTDGNMPKVMEVSRQLVFVRPEVIIVFDRVESLDPSFQKRFLLHASGTGVMPKVSGSSFTIDNNGGRLLGQTLLPAGAAINLVTNWSVAGTPYPPDMSALPNEPELGGNRLEVVPAAPARRDYFLHVFDATDPSKSSLPATVADGPDQSTVTIMDGPNTYVVSFSKTGALGGHIKVTGTVNCDADLGSMATMGTSTGAGGASGTGGAGSGTGGSTGGPGKKGGCGCRTAGGDDLPLSPILVALLAIARRVHAPRSRRGRPDVAPS